MLDHLRVATRPRWVGLTIFVLVMVATFSILGQWQLGRADQQSVSDGLRDRARGAEPADISALSRPGVRPAEALQWRPVTATGTYDADHQVLVRNRSLQSSNGYLVLVPLRTDAGPDLVVLRGWIPAGSTAATPAALPTVPTGIVSIQGRLRVPEPPTTDSGLPEGQVERIVPDEIAALTGQPTYGAWVVLGTEQPTATGSELVRAVPDGSTSTGRWPISHTVYAFQWFIFAVIAGVGWFVLLRRDVTTQRPPPNQPPPSPEQA